MSPQLVQQLETLSSTCNQVRPGDIASMAGLLEQCETLRQVGELEQLAGLQATAEALGEHLTRMIMGESADDAEDMQVLHDSVDRLHAAFTEGQPLRAEDFPAALNLAPWPANGSAPHPDAEPALGEAPIGAVQPDAPLRAALEGADAEAQDTAWEQPAPELDTLEEHRALAGMDVEVSDVPVPEAPEDSTLIGGSEGAFAADTELLSEYLGEQRGRLEEIEGHLLTLERTQDDTALADLRRALHTIKGDSGFLGLSAVAQISHAAESYLEVADYPYDLEYLFGVKDWLARAFENLAATSRLSAGTQASLRSLLATLNDRVAAGTRAPAVSAASATVELSDEAPAPGERSGSDLIAELAGAAAAEPPPARVEPPPPPPAPSPPIARAPARPTAPARPVDRPLPQEPFFHLSADESLLVDFISESKEHLDEASSQLLSLENEPENEEAINSVFRAFHTVKGIAGFLNLQEISVLAHGTESLLDQVRRDEVELSPPLIDLVFEALDWMTRLSGNVRKGLQEGGQVPTEPDLGPFMARVSAAQQGVFTPADGGARPQRLGEILVEVGAVEPEEMEEAVQEAARSYPAQKLGEVLVAKELVTPSQVHAALREQANQGQPSRKAVELKETLRVDYERLENMINTIGELVLAEAMISQDEQVLGIDSEGLEKKLYNLRQVSRKLQELGTTIRMVPISGTFQKMARLVRDLSRKSGKPVNFVSHGDETELDRAYVDLIADPLVHMIRNAVDHGIENPTERRQSGKPEMGQIGLRAFHEGGNINVQVSDDGKGLNVERIFAKAVEKELVAAEDRDKMTEQEIYQLIFLPGFSTAAQVTEVSGRGVGMDVVRRNIAELRGQVQISSELGKGTTFRIILPLTLALIDGMLVRVGSERFIFPVLSVVESARPTREMVNTIIGKGEIISLRGRQLPLYRLGRLFRVPDAKEDVTDSLVVVVENDGRQVGIMVDDLIGIQQTVIKSLGNGLFDIKGLSGGSIMADGTVGLIVDVSGLISIARTRDATPAEALN